jgi:predicted RNA-binding protein with TRAM domain
VPGAFSVPVGDEGGALADGVDQDGVITSGDLDLWTFSATAGDRITLQLTELTGGAGFTPKIEMFAPNGERREFAQNATAATLDTAIELGGSYTVLVSDATKSGTGTYRLRLTRGSIAPPGANVLTNGAAQTGSISSAGASNSWTFPASAGDAIVLRIGEITQTGSFVPRIRLFNPTSVQLAAASSSLAAGVAVTATNTGTFTVIVDDAGAVATGTYRLTLAKTGSPIGVSTGDEGGPLTNGAVYTGTIDVGDLDVWSFTANAGERIGLRMGELVAGSPLTPALWLYGPDGALLDSYGAGGVAAEVSVRATNSGTFTVVAGDNSSFLTGSGTYRLKLLKTGSPIVVSAGDEGGPLTNGVVYDGTIDVGDVDGWTFIANAGENIAVRMAELVPGSPLIPGLWLYGPDGALLDSYGAGGVAAGVSVRATNSGIFTVVAGDNSSFFKGSGNYRLTIAKTGLPIVV